MKNHIVSSLLRIMSVATLGVFAGGAEAAVTSPGFEFRATTPADAACFSRSGYAGIVNNCSTAREVTATLPITSEGWFTTYAVIHGNNSWCQSVITDMYGNGYQVGPTVWIGGATKAWQTANTGDRYVWTSTPLVFRCWLESGGIISKFGVL